MDPLQNDREDNESISDNPPEQSIIVVHNIGQVQVQLEGSHTTATETESPSLNGKEKKNVKFEDVIKEIEVKSKDYDNENDKEDNKLGLEEQLPSSPTSSNANKSEDISPRDKKNKSEDSLTLFKRLDQSHFKQIGNENLEIAQRFKQIMEMFENFSRNLESLDLETKSSEKFAAGPKISAKRKRSKSSYSEEQNKKQRRHVEEKPMKSVNNTDLQETDSTETTASEPNLIAINTSCGDCSYTPRPSQNFACQTSTSDQYSLNDLSLLEVSSITSRSEPPNSLNNYAHAENALDANKQPQIPDLPAKSPKLGGFPETMATRVQTERHTDWESLSQVIVEQPSNHTNIHTIHIEANSVPSASDLRRLPFCQRLWSVLGDFCAATLLCLQVNRDCIFCLGFFAAFVVSASFLTAFFYHTLTVSPSIWQTSDSLTM